MYLVAWTYTLIQYLVQELFESSPSLYVPIYTQSGLSRCTKKNSLVRGDILHQAQSSIYVFHKPLALAPYLSSVLFKDIVEE